MGYGVDWICSVGSSFCKYVLEQYLVVDFFFKPYCKDQWRYNITQYTQLVKIKTFCNEAGNNNEKTENMWGYTNQAIT